MKEMELVIQDEWPETLDRWFPRFIRMTSLHPVTIKSNKTFACPGPVGDSCSTVILILSKQLFSVHPRHGGHHLGIIFRMDFWRRIDILLAFFRP